MTMRRNARYIAAAIGAAMLVAACGSSPALSTPSATPSATPTQAVSATSAVSGWTWTVSDKSKATIRVRESARGRKPAVRCGLTATGAKAPSLDPDGTFAWDRRSRSRSRRSRATSGTGRLREARHAAGHRFPQRSSAPTDNWVTLPMPTSGTSVPLTKHDYQGPHKEVTFDLAAKRDGSDLTATATANPGWKLATLGYRAVGVVPRAQHRGRDPRHDRHRRDGAEGLVAAERGR